MPARHHLLVFSASLLMASLGAPSAARAQCVTATLEIYHYPKTTIEMNKFFNMANCKCKTKVEVYLRFSKIPNNASCSGQKIQIMAGQNCYNDSTSAFSTSCVTLQKEIDLGTITKVEWPVGTYSANEVMGNNSCTEVSAQTNAIFVYYKGTGSSTNWSSNSTMAKMDITIDTQGPTDPVKDVAPKAGENQIEVTFKSAYTASSGDGGTGATKEKDLKGYQILCAKLDKEGGTVQGAGLATAKGAIYETPATTCSGTQVDGGVVADASVDSTSTDSSAGTSWPPGPLPRANEAGVAEAGAKDAATVDAKAVDAGMPDTSSTFPDSGSTSTGDTVENVPLSYVCSEKISTDGSATIKGLSNGTAYRFWVVAVDDLGNASKLVLLGDATPQQEEDLWERYKRSGGGAKGEYCFVATAAYGDYDHPHVLVLRDFRDRVLLTSGPGRAVVDTYYRLGQAPARWLEGSDGWRAAARAALWPVTLAAGAVVYTSPWQKGLALMCLGVAVMLVGLRARRRQPKDSKGGQS